MNCKKAKRMADGGILLADAGAKETPEQMLARMNAKYGLGDAGKSSPQQAPAPQPAPQQVEQRQAPSAGLLGRVVEGIGNRSQALREVSRYARGGIMPVVGAGTGTSDSIPVVVAGQKVRLSNGEGAAILPAKTMKNAAAVHAIEEIIEATNGKPAVKSDDEEDDEEMACGGVKGKRMAGGGVIDPEEQKRQMTNYVVPTPAPTAQEVYSSVPGVSRSGNSFTQTDARPVSAPAARTVASETDPLRKVLPGTADVVRGIYGDVQSETAAGNYPGAVGKLARGMAALPVGIASDALDLSGVKQLAPSIGTALKTFATGESTPINKEQRQGSSPPFTVTSAQADRTIEATPTPVQSASVGTGNVGDARFNAQNGVLSFTDKSFDPTKQQFAPGTGAITDPRTGRTMLLTGGAADNPASGTSAQAASMGISGGRDAYGNSTAITQQLQGQLADQRAEQATAQAAWDKQNAGRPSYEQQRNAEADRFARFVNESDAARLAHDLGTGGGTARTNAGKIAALHEMQNASAAAQAGQTARDLAAANGANHLAGIDAQGRNQLANTALTGQNQLAVEDVRQSGPDKALKAVQTQGQIEDANAQRLARQGLFSAIDSNDPARIAAETKKGIAAGILKDHAEKPQAPYRAHTDPMGNMTRVNEATGATDVLDRATNTWKPVGSLEQAPREPANRKVGQVYQTPNGQMIWRGTGWEPAQAR